MNTYKVTYIESGLRLDKVLVSFMSDKSRTYVSKLIDDGNVLVNGKVEKASLKVKEDDVIEVNIPEDKPLTVEKEDIPLDVVYEDSDILIINKPQGMVVHPAPGNYNGTLVNALMYHTSLSNDAVRPGIVHRLDKNTSGLIIIAKNDKAHISMSNQIQNREVKKSVFGISKRKCTKKFNFSNK